MTLKYLLLTWKATTSRSRVSFIIRARIAFTVGVVCWLVSLARKSSCVRCEHNLHQWKGKCLWLANTVNRDQANLDTVYWAICIHRCVFQTCTRGHLRFNENYAANQSRAKFKLMVFLTCWLNCSKTRRVWRGEHSVRLSGLGNIIRAQPTKSIAAYNSISREYLKSWPAGACWSRSCPLSRVRIRDSSRKWLSRRRCARTSSAQRSQSLFSPRQRCFERVIMFLMASYMDYTCWECLALLGRTAWR